MKKIYSLLVMMLIGFAASWADTSTLTFESKCNGSGTADDGVEWTVTSDGTESTYDNTKGIHYGTGSNAVQYIELSTSGITGTITQVVVNASTASGVSATASVTVGGEAFGGDAQSLSTTATDYTFTGSASGEIVVTVTKPSSATKAIYVKSVAVTYTEGGEPAETYTINYNAMENGSVTGPAEAAEGATVTLTVTPDSGYQLATLTVEDDDDVAISVSNNKFTMPAGPVYVSATFEEIPPITSLATVNAFADGTEFTFTAPTVVLGVKNRNMYIATADNAAGTLLYATSNWDSGYTFGKEIAAGWSGTKTTYNTKPEITSPADVALSGNDVTLTPVEISAADLTLANFGRYAVLRSAVSDGSAITDADNVAVTVYNQFDVAVPATAGTYDIYGVIGWNNGAGQFMILSYEAVDVPEPTKYAIEIDAQIANGTVVADKAEAAEGETVTLTVTPATGYELEAITVLDANLEEVTVSNNAFTMPASDVLVSATFVEQGEQPQPTTEGTATFVFNTEGGNYYYTADTDIIDVELTAGDITLVFGKTSGTSPKYYASDHTARAYNGSTMTFTAPTGSNITAIAFDYERGGAGSADSGTYGNGAWSGSSNSVVISLTATTRVKSITVTYAAAEPVSEEFYITATPPAGTYEGPQVVYIEAHNGEIEEALYTVNEGETQTYNAETGIAIDAAGENSIYVYATDTEGNEAELNLTYTITYPDVEIAVSPEAGTYYEAQNVHVTVAGTYGEDVLIGYKFAEEDQYIEYDDEAGIDITESCTLYVNVVTDYQDTEASFEYVITEAPELLTENATIVFTSGSNDGSAFTGNNAAIDEGADLIASITNYDKFYTNGANGAKFGTGSVAGKATINLVNGYAATKVVVKAMAYGSDSGVTFKLNGTESETIATDELADYEFTLDGTGIYSLAFEASKSSKCRFWVKSIDIICSEQPEGISLAEALAGGEGLISNDLTVVKVYNGKAYLTDGEDNWVSIEGGNAAQLTPGAVIDGYQLSGIANAGTSPAITISEDVTFTQGENIPTIDELDLRTADALEMPKAGKVVSITGYYLQENGQNVFSAYSGANGSKGNTIPLADAGSMTVGSEYTIEAAITLTEAWDAEQSAGAPRRVSPTSDDALKNITLSLVGEPVSTAVNDIAVDADVVSVKYVNVAGQVSAQPFDGINVVVTTYVDGTTKAVKVVK
ncbi:MAG: hypothetical protein IJU62_04455 [Muribaculaceae bacterium]|nr:hypothetical protein [Muribaculaceae bacterium]